MDAGGAASYHASVLKKDAAGAGDDGGGSGPLRLRMDSSTGEATIVHHSDRRGAWASRFRTILHADTPGGPWRAVTDFPADQPQDLLALGGRLARRVLRADKCNVRPTRAGLLLGIRRSVVYRIDPDGVVPPVPLARIEGDCLMNRAMAEAEDGSIYFGEYFMNPKRIPVGVWRVDAELTRCECVYRFETPRVRHVHAIHADPHHAGRLWITMGDFAEECYVAYTDDDFSRVDFEGDGSQLWRAVGLLFEPERLHWLTDTHIEENRIVSMERATGELRVHGERSASSWYAAQTREGLFVATTTVEPGPGIHTSQVHLLASRDAVEWHEVLSFQKDRWPVRQGFGFGSLSLPSGELSAEGFWISGEGVVGLDGRSAFCRLDAEP